MSEELKQILDSIKNIDSKFEKSIENVNQRIDEIAEDPGQVNLSQSFP